LVAALAEGDPYSMAFVDVRMPPGWDGIQTIKELWKADTSLECVICTAFSDYSWSEMAKELGQSDKLLILKKPFDPVEARQLASTLTTKWSDKKAQTLMTQQLIEAEGKAKAYAASLETMNQALRTGKAAADKDSELRGSFLRKLSRQVTTSVGSLIQTVEHAVTGKPEVDSELDRNRALLHTVDGVMTFTSLELGRFQSQAQDVELGDTLGETVERFQECARETGSQLTLDMDPDVNRSYFVDGPSVQRITHLLLENAVQHAKGSNITVKARLECGEDWSRPTLHVTVSDTGPGLPESSKGSVFEANVQNDDADGFGIGLALAKHLAQATGGDLQYEPLVPHGSCFTFHTKLAASGEGINRAA
ncbi:MAG: hybrid sensor histidine kinase/response regulator, partial [Planctomycetes bacterium]|nr:hybrid sensor histidine kinase/response regulator [Planctomycetota bacterium]